MSLQSLARLAIPLARAAGNWARWIRQVSSDVDLLNGDFLTQAAWFVDPVNGSDANQGDTSATALETVGEFERRVGAHVGTLKQPTTLTLLNDVNETIQFTANVVYPGQDGATSTDLVIQGSQVQERTGTMTVVTTQDPTTDTPLTISDGAAFTAADVGKMVRITGSVNPTSVGAVAWVAAVSGGNVATLNSFETVSTTGSAVTARTPVTGDTYEILHQTRIDGFFRLYSETRVSLNDLHIEPTRGFVVDSPAPTNFRRSKVVGDISATPVNGFTMGALNLSGCLFNTNSKQIACEMNVFGCLLTGTLGGTGGLNVNAGGRLTMGTASDTAGSLVYGNATTPLIRVAAQGFMGTLSPVGFLNNANALDVASEGFVDARLVMWGTVTGTAIRVDSQGGMVVSTVAANKPSIANGGTDVDVGGTATAFGAQAINATNGAAYVERALAI